MSYKVTAWVLEHSEATLAARLVLLTMAERARDDGGSAFEAVETIARKSRIGESTARACLRRLEAEGRIEPTGKTRYGTIIYRIKMADAPEMKGARIEQGPESSRGQISANGGPDPGPDPLVNRHFSPSGEKVVGGARARPRIGGKVVNDDAWRLTAQVLAEYDRQTGQSHHARTGSGAPSESAKRIYLRVVAFPDLSFEDHHRIISITLASKWWGAGKPSVGVVYGPKRFEENMNLTPSDPPSRQSVRDARDAHKVEYEQTRQRRYEALKRVAGIAKDPDGDPPQPTTNGGHDGTNDRRRVGGDRGDSAGLLAG